MSEFSNGINPSEFEVNKPNKTAERIQRLEKIVTDPNFDIALIPSAQRVSNFLEHENDTQLKSWDTYLKTAYDYKLYKDLNPEWDNLNRRGVRNKGGTAFYRAVTKQSKNQIEMSPEEFMKIVFPSQIEKNKSHIISKETTETTTQIKAEKTPQERTAERIKKLEEMVADPNFNTTLTNSVERVSNFLEHENDTDTKPWKKYFKTVYDFKLYKDLNPKWKDLNQYTIGKTKEGNSFLRAINNHCRLQTNIPRSEIIKIIFPPSAEQEQQTQQRMNRLAEMVKNQPDLVNNESYQHVYEFLQHENDTYLKPWPKYLKTAYDYKLYKDLNYEWIKANQNTIKNFKEGEAFSGAVSRQNKKQTEMSSSEFIKIIFPPSAEQEQQTQQRIGRLIEIVKNQPDLVNTESYQHVYEFLQHENDTQRKPWPEYFKTAYDYKLYKDLNPEWANSSQKSIIRLEDGEAFLGAAFRQSKKQTDLSPEEFMKIIFSPQNNKTEKINQNINTKNIIEKQTAQPEDLVMPTKETTKPINQPQPEFNPIILPASPIDFSQQEKLPSNFINGITTEVVNTTSEIKETENNGNGNGNYGIPFKPELTPAQIIRLMCGKGEWNGELYQKHSGEIASYLINRGEIAYFLNYFSKTNQQFPQTIVDLGAGPSIGYNAYQEFQPELDKLGINSPTVIDIEKNDSMFTNGNNPNKIQQDISKPLPFSDQQADLIQSTFVFHWLKPQETLQTLIESNRITKIGGHLSLVCREPFSNSFISAVEQLGYHVITDHGEILSPNQKMLDAIIQQSDSQHADRLKNKFKKAFILFAKKETNISEITNLPSSESFTFDHVKKNTRERNPITDLKNYDIEAQPLTENLQRITDSLIYNTHYLEISPLRQEGGLIPGADEIRSSYDIFNGNLNSIQSLYDKIYNQIKGQFNKLTEEQQNEFAQLREQLKTTREYKKYFYQRYVR